MPAHELFRASLDILVDGFEKLECAQVLATKRVKLLQTIDSVLGSQAENIDLSARELNKIANKADVKAKWSRAKSVWKELQDGKADWGQVEQAVETFFAADRSGARLAVLKKSPDYAEVHQLKLELLRDLRDHGVAVLARGAIEDYYPPTVTGPDKPSRAQQFC